MQNLFKKVNSKIVIIGIVSAIVVILCVVGIVTAVSYTHLDVYKSQSKKKDTGLSLASMQTMISADSSMKQAKVQGSMATQMQGRASVLESEIKQDAGKGNTEKKEEELAELQAKAQSATRCV